MITLYVILALAALLPPLYLIHFIYKKDKVDKEPVGLVTKTFIFGAISAFPAIVLELILGAIIMALFPGYTALYYAADAFIGVALAEEFVKMQAMKLSVWKNPNFNYTFDGVVYAAAAALGFAALENLLYVFANGLGTALVRAVTSIPGHCIFGIFMGMYLGIAKLCQSRGDHRGMRINKIKALLIPLLIHGFYDWMLFFEETWSMLLFLVFVIIMDMMTIKMLNRLEAKDMLIPGPMSGAGPVTGAGPMPGAGYVPEAEHISKNPRLEELEKKYK